MDQKQAKLVASLLCPLGPGAKAGCQLLPGARFYHSTSLQPTGGQEARCLRGSSPNQHSSITWPHHHGPFPSPLSIHTYPTLRDTHTPCLVSQDPHGSHTQWGYDPCACPGPSQVLGTGAGTAATSPKEKTCDLGRGCVKGREGDNPEPRD